MVTNGKSIVLATIVAMVTMVTMATMVTMTTKGLYSSLPS